MVDGCHSNVVVVIAMADGCHNKFVVVIAMMLGSKPQKTLFSSGNSAQLHDHHGGAAGPAAWDRGHPRET